MKKLMNFVLAAIGFTSVGAIGSPNSKGQEIISKKMTVTYTPFIGATRGTQDFTAAK